MKMRSGAVLAVCAWLSCAAAEGAGTTIITHGWNPAAGTPVWMESMRDAIAGGYANGETNYATIRVTKSGGALAVACDPWEEDAPNGASGEVVAVLDWSAVANHLAGGPSVQEVAAAAAVAIADGQNGQRALAELPLHLIGHSRGGALVSELARELGERGIVVDQVTMLDPHPLTLADPQPLGSATIDAVPTAYENVLYADAYSQTNAYPKGMLVAGAYNRLWSGLAGGYYDEGVAFGDHPNVHLLYQGTIDLRNPVDNGEAEMDASERAAWFNGYEAMGTNTGFAHSRLAGRLDRSSTNRPVAGGVAARNGLHPSEHFGGGGTRQNLARSGSQWPNAALLEIRRDGKALGKGTHAISNGAALQLRLVSLDNDGGYSVEYRLDTDRCPYNGNDVGGISTQEFAAGTGGAFRETLVDWEAATAGDLSAVYIYAKAIDGTRTRYAYAAEALTWYQETGGWDDGYRNLGGGWRRLGWLGDYAPTVDWIWHHRHGFWYPAAGGTSTDAWFYSQDMGWLYTGKALYPFMYRASDGAWIWYNGATNPRWFKNFTSGQWESRP